MRLTPILAMCSRTTMSPSEYYAVDFTADGQTYEYDIDAITGVIIEKNTPGGQSTDTAGASSATDGASGTTGASAQGSTPSNGGFVGEDAAKQAALKHAGLEESQVTFFTLLSGLGRWTPGL